MNLSRRDVLHSMVAGALSATIFSSLGAETAPAPKLRIQRLSWAGVKLVCGDSTLFIDASYDPSSASAASPDVALTVETRDKNALITHHHGDHFDAAALRAALGENGIVV